MAESFATAGDLEDRWQSLTEDQTSRAEALLAAASRIVRAKFKTVDARVVLPVDDPSYLDPDLLTDVVCEMVREVMSVSVPGTTQQSSSVGAVSTSMSFSVAAGRLYLTRQHIELLTPAITRSRASSTSSLPGHAQV